MGHGPKGQMPKIPAELVVVTNGSRRGKTPKNQRTKAAIVAKNNKRRLEERPN
jgi:hypothetical protein